MGSKAKISKYERQIGTNVKILTLQTFGLLSFGLCKLLTQQPLDFLALWTLGLTTFLPLYSLDLGTFSFSLPCDLWQPFGSFRFCITIFWPWNLNSLFFCVLYDCLALIPFRRDSWLLLRVANGHNPCRQEKSSEFASLTVIFDFKKVWTFSESAHFFPKISSFATKPLSKFLHFW